MLGGYLGDQGSFGRGHFPGITLRSVQNVGLALTVSDPAAQPCLGRFEFTQSTPACGNEIAWWRKAAWLDTGTCFSSSDGSHVGFQTRLNVLLGHVQLATNYDI